MGSGRANYDTIVSPNDKEKFDVFKVAFSDRSIESGNGKLFDTAGLVAF